MCFRLSAHMLSSGAAWPSCGTPDRGSGDSVVSFGSLSPPGLPCLASMGEDAFILLELDVPWLVDIHEASHPLF